MPNMQKEPLPLKSDLLKESSGTGMQCLPSGDQPLQGPASVSRSQYLQMVGRAGRAGQAQKGESFLLGNGEAFSQAGEWNAVCALLEAPLPRLTSRLLADTCSDAEGKDSLTPQPNRQTAGACPMLQLLSSQLCFRSWK